MEESVEERRVRQAKNAMDRHDAFIMQVPEDLKFLVYELDINASVVLRYEDHFRKKYNAPVA